MASTQPDLADQRSDGLSLNLSSNNPFRNRAVSPSLKSPTSPFDDPPPRPMSRNPFLDPAIASKPSQQTLNTSTDTMSTSADKKASPTAEDLFDSLTLEDKKSPPSKAPPPRPEGAKPPMNRRGPPPGRENMPPGRRGPPPNHRPTRSQEEALRARRAQGSGSGPFDSSRSPQRRPERRPRRNSDSSALDAEKPMTEEEKKARELRRRERERRHRESRDKKPVNRKLDIIDQLDATSIYGTGLFHHDGPFDALNPHRNRQGSRRAPMQAFPKDSLNNVIGGAGPLNARPDHAAIMGHHDEEAFKDFASGAKDRPDMPGGIRKGEMFDPLSRGSILHGDESMGLGTSTFLEGTPAARTAIQKREEERAADIVNDGLQRKKSLAQRIRNINRGPRDFQPGGRMTNPEGAYMSRRSPSDGGIVTSASLQSSSNERNPFFNEFEGTEETISVRKPDFNRPMGSPPAPTSPKGLERRATSDSIEQAAKPATGLLGRMKSLKTGRRPRGNTSGQEITTGPSAPGTAV